MKYNIDDKVYYVCYSYKVVYGRIYKIEKGVSSGDIYYQCEDVDTGARQRHILLREKDLFINKEDADAEFERQKPKRISLSAEEQLIQEQEIQKAHEEFKNRCEANKNKRPALDYNGSFISRDATEEEIKLWEESAKEILGVTQLGELPKTLKINNDKIKYVYELVSKEAK